MKKIHCILLLAICLTGNLTAHAQRINPADKHKLAAAEDTLKELGYRMVFDSIPGRRFAADSMFIRHLVSALKTPNSFYYPFDSVDYISRLYAPDSSFRIFTWEFEKDDAFHRQRGAIQMNTPDGSLKLFPLIDMSDYIDNLYDSVRSNLNWVGAIYYKIIMKTFNDKKYYTLIGIDDYNATTTRKWIEVLWFAQNGQPRFGGRFFSYKADSTKPPQPAYRFAIEYKKDAKARMNYDPKLDLIVFEHLVSLDGKPWRTSTLLPDGDYEGFRWEDGKWTYVEKAVMYDKLQDGQAPIPKPLKDDAGLSDEKALEAQSLKTLEQYEQSQDSTRQKPIKPVKKKKQ